MNRRSVLAGVVAMAGGKATDQIGAGWGGNTPMRPDQANNLPVTRAGSGPAPASPVVVARRVIIVGPSGGLFVYSPTAAHGNLIASIAASAGTDPYGNAYPAGFASFNTGLGIVGQFEGSVLQWTNPASLPDLFPLIFARPSAAGSSLAIASGAGAAATEITLLLEDSLDSSIGQPRLRIEGGGLQIGATSPAKLTYPPSGDLTGAADVAAINTALAAGIAVELIPGAQYFINNDINVPNFGVLVAGDRTMGEPSGNYGAGGLTLAGAILQMTHTFAGDAALRLTGTGSQGGGQVIKGITVDGTLLPAGTFGGLLSTGYIAGVTLRDVLLFGGGNGGVGLQVTNDGTPGHNGDFWDVSHCKVSGWGGAGINVVGLADTYWTAVESTGNNGDNWLIENCSNSRWLGCKGENSATGVDWNFKNDSGFTGTLTFAACTSEASGSASGRSWQGTGTGTYIFRGCVFPNGTVYPANQTATISDDLPPVFDLVTGDFTGVAETIIGSYTIPANYLNQANAQLRFHLWGRSIAANIGDTIQLRLRANGVAGTILLDFGAIIATTGNQRFSVDGVVGVDGAGAGGQLDTSAVLNSTIAGLGATLVAASTGSVNVPLNAAVVFDLTAKMSAAGDEAKTLGGTMILDAAS